MTTVYRGEIESTLSLDLTLRTRSCEFAVVLRATLAKLICSLLVPDLS